MLLNIFSAAALPETLLHIEGGRMSTSALTRRSLWGGAATLAAAVASRANAQSESAKAPIADALGVSKSSAAIHQEVLFKAAPRRVYEALTDPEIFQKLVVLSGAIQAMALQSRPAQISAEPGGAFALFGGYITGRQVELTPSERIIQAWRSAGWAPHIYSIARFEIAEHPGGARLTFDHTGFPTDDAHSLATGWQDHYWAPLAKVLGQ
jgi:activator of HSP90 ATPase